MESNSVKAYVLVALACSAIAMHAMGMEEVSKPEQQVMRRVGPRRVASQGADEEKILQGLEKLWIAYEEQCVSVQDKKDTSECAQAAENIQKYYTAIVQLVYRKRIQAQFEREYRKVKGSEVPLITFEVRSNSDGQVRPCFVQSFKNPTTGEERKNIVLRMPSSLSDFSTVLFFSPSLFSRVEAVLWHELAHIVNNDAVHRQAYQKTLDDRLWYIGGSYTKPLTTKIKDVALARQHRLDELAADKYGADLSGKDLKVREGLMRQLVLEEIPAHVALLNNPVKKSCGDACLAVVAHYVPVWIKDIASTKTHPSNLERIRALILEELHHLQKEQPTLQRKEAVEMVQKWAQNIIISELGLINAAVATKMDDAQRKVFKAFLIRVQNIITKACIRTIK